MAGAQPRQCDSAHEIPARIVSAEAGAQEEGQSPAATFAFVSRTYRPAALPVTNSGDRCAAGGLRPDAAAEMNFVQWGICVSSRFTRGQYTAPAVQARHRLLAERFNRTRRSIRMKTQTSCVVRTVKRFAALS